MTALPVILDGVPEADYHADRVLGAEYGRTLSASGMKVLLRSPARFAWERENGQPSKTAFDFGHAAHKYALGVGEKVRRIYADDWRTAAARQARDEAYAAGHIPMLAADADRALAVAEAIHDHPAASRILAAGKAEQSIYWTDEQAGVTCRARLDWLRPELIADVKTCRDAGEWAFGKAAHDFGYHISAAQYVAGVEAVTGERLPFLLIAAEKEPPHRVAVYQLDGYALDLGEQRRREALDTYAEGESSGVWPSGLPDDVTLLPLPAYA